MVSVGNYKYWMRPAGSYPGTSGYSAELDFKEKVLAGKTSLPMVRMNNGGTENDFKKVNVNGKVVVLDRGGISFGQKMINASKAGAIAVLCANNLESSDGNSPFGSFVDLSSAGNDVKIIPFFSISYVAGQKLNGQTNIDFVLTTNPVDVL